MINLANIHRATFGIFILFLSIACSSNVFAGVNKCKLPNGKIVYSAKPCPTASQSQKLPKGKGLGNSGTTLRHSDEPYTYKKLYDEFRCTGIGQGLKLIPGKNSVNAIMRDILFEPLSKDHKLARSSGGWTSSKGPTSNHVCFVLIDKTAKRTTLKFGLSSFKENDAEVWTGQQLAKLLSRRGYSFRGLDSEYRNSFDVEWGNTDFKCEIDVDDDTDDSPPHIGVTIECDGRT